MPRRILFAVHHWGLGHATRSLVAIRALVARGDAVTILAEEGPGMRLLRAELGPSCEYVACRDTPAPFSVSPVVFYVRMSLAMPAVLATFAREHRFTERLVRERRFDCVISDSRLGVWSREAPSFCIFHSLRQIVPRMRRIEPAVEWGQRALLRGFTRVLIPDVEEDGGLSGYLGHDPRLDWGAGRLVWIGPLSSVSRPGVAQDVDYFFSVSGMEPQHGLLERLVLDALPRVPGRVVVALGRPARAGETRTVGNATVHGFLDRERQAQMLNRARVVVGRSGYTTLMELAELGKRALFIPTPGQSEQEYLARHHHARGHVWSVAQREVDFARDLARAEARAGLPRISPERSVERLLAAIA